jgi:hypothetical protein
MATVSGGRWGRWSTLLAGLPYDVQSALYERLKDRSDLRPQQCYRLPIIFSSQRLNVTVGGTANDSWRFLSLSAVYGISKSFENETIFAGGTGGISGVSLAYPGEVGINISFNEGATNWIGSASEPCSLASIGDANHVTRMDPICPARNDVWDLALTGDAAMVNAVFSRVTLHGVKLYNAGGAI